LARPQRRYARYGTRFRELTTSGVAGRSILIQANPCAGFRLPGAGCQQMGREFTDGLVRRSDEVYLPPLGPGTKYR
jgi:hypothetical protein